MDRKNAMEVKDFKDFKVEDIMPQPLQRNGRPDLSDIFEETMRSNETEKQTGTGEGTETAPTDAADPSEERVTAKRISGKQRRLSLEEYRTAYLQVPKITDRKPVFVSGEVRDRLDEVARRLGGRRMSVSGLLENIARHHLSFYESDIEQWRKI